MLYPDQLGKGTLHPGYGGKEGSPTEDALTKAGHNIVAETVTRWHLPIEIIGESLGTAVACAVAADPGVDRLALISLFLSALSVAQQKIPILPMLLLMKDTYRSDLFLKTVKVPLFVVHGVDDDVVPFGSGKALFDSYGGQSKWFAAIPGAKHNDMVPFLLRAPEAEGFRTFVRSGDGG